MKKIKKNVHKISTPHVPDIEIDDIALLCYANVMYHENLSRYIFAPIQSPRNNV